LNAFSFVFSRFFSLICLHLVIIIIWNCW
jgi:hypothetical protein